MTVRHTATLEITANTQLAQLVELLDRNDIPPTAQLDVTAEPRLQHPTDPGGRKTLTISWSTA